MAKKRPPGWQKKQEQKKQDRVADSGFTMLHGQEAQEGLKQLLGRMEQNPENFSNWGYFDADGNEHNNLDFLKEGGKGGRP